MLAWCVQPGKLTTPYYLITGTPNELLKPLWNTEIVCKSLKWNIEELIVDSSILMEMELWNSDLYAEII